MLISRVISSYECSDKSLHLNTANESLGGEEKEKVLHCLHTLFRHDPFNDLYEVTACCTEPTARRPSDQRLICALSMASVALIINAIVVVTLV